MIITSMPHGTGNIRVKMIIHEVFSPRGYIRDANLKHSDLKILDEVLF